MKKYYFTITSLLVLAIGITSCSNEETKTQNNTASRPTVPVMANEVQIGNQIWMTKNLNVSRYRNGDPIPQVTNPTQWANLTTGAWCYYNNDPANGPIYGKLYNWYAVIDPRGLAPAGWHVPSDAEWTILTTFLGFTDVAGAKMKATGTLEAGTGLWKSPNASATNSSGFSALPGGTRSFIGLFSNVGFNGYWWSSSEYDNTNVWYGYLFYTNGSAYRNYAQKVNGFSVRCIKN
jgi:uncharacterized protein (TIGR02145 family)